MSTIHHSNLPTSSLPTSGPLHVALQGVVKRKLTIEEGERLLKIFDQCVHIEPHGLPKMTLHFDKLGFLLQKELHHAKLLDYDVCFTGGGARHVVAPLPFSDRDIHIYLNSPNLPLFKQTLANVLRFFVAKSDNNSSKLKDNQLLTDYVSERYTEFQSFDKLISHASVAFGTGIMKIQIAAICNFNQRISVGSFDGYHISFKDPFLFCINGTKTCTESELNESIQKLTKQREITSIEEMSKVKKLAFRINLCRNIGLRIYPVIVQAAQEELRTKYCVINSEYISFLSLTIAFEDHQKKHFPEDPSLKDAACPLPFFNQTIIEQGRICDFLNMLFDHARNDLNSKEHKALCSALVRGFRIGKERFLGYFTTLLNRYPNQSDNLLKVVHGLFFYIWTLRLPEIQTRLNCYPQYENDQPVRLQMCVNNQGFEYCFSVNDTPTQLAIHFIQALEKWDKEGCAPSSDELLSKLCEDFGLAFPALAKDRKSIIEQLMNGLVHSPTEEVLRAVNESPMPFFNFLHENKKIKELMGPTLQSRTIQAKLMCLPQATRDQVAAAIDHFLTMAKKAVQGKEKSRNEDSKASWRRDEERLTLIGKNLKEICADEKLKNVLERSILLLLERAKQIKNLSAVLLLGKFALQANPKGMFLDDQVKKIKELCIETSRKMIDKEDFSVYAKQDVSLNKEKIKFFLEAMQELKNEVVEEVLTPWKERLAKQITRKDFSAAIQSLNILLLDRTTKFLQEIQKQFALLLNELNVLSSSELKELAELAFRITSISPNLITENLRKIALLVFKNLSTGDQNKICKDLLSHVKNIDDIKADFFDVVADALFRHDESSQEYVKNLFTLMLQVAPHAEWLLKLKNEIEDRASNPSIACLKFLSDFDPAHAYRVIQRNAQPIQDNSLLLNLLERFTLNPSHRLLAHEVREKYAAAITLTDPSVRHRISCIFLEHLIDLIAISDAPNGKKNVCELGRQLISILQISSQRTLHGEETKFSQPKDPAIVKAWILCINFLLATQDRDYLLLAHDLFREIIAHNFLSKEENQKLACSFLEKSCALDQPTISKDYVELALTRSDAKTVRKVTKYIEKCLAIDSSLAFSALLSLLKALSQTPFKQSLEKEWQKSIEPSFLSILTTQIDHTKENAALELLSNAEKQLLEKMSPEGKEKLLGLLTSVTIKELVEWCWKNWRHFASPKVDALGTIANHAWTIWQAEPKNYLDRIADELQKTNHPVLYRLFLESLQGQTDTKYLDIINKLDVKISDEPPSKMALGYHNLFQYVTHITLKESSNTIKKVNAEFLYNKWMSDVTRVPAETWALPMRHKVLEDLLNVMLSVKEAEFLRRTITLIHQEHLEKSTQRILISAIEQFMELPNNSDYYKSDQKNINDLVIKVISDEKLLSYWPNISMIITMFTHMIQEKSIATMYQCLRSPLIRSLILPETLTSLLNSLVDIDSFNHFENLENIQTLARNLRIDLLPRISVVLSAIFNQLNSKEETTACEIWNRAKVFLKLANVASFHSLYPNESLKIIQNFLLEILTSTKLKEDGLKIQNLFCKLVSSRGHRSAEEWDRYLHVFRRPLLDAAFRLNIPSIIIGQLQPSFASRDAKALLQSKINISLALLMANLVNDENKAWQDLIEYVHNYLHFLCYQFDEEFDKTIPLMMCCLFSFLPTLPQLHKTDNFVKPYSELIDQGQSVFKAIVKPDHLNIKNEKYLIYLLTAIETITKSNALCNHNNEEFEVAKRASVIMRIKIFPKLYLRGEKQTWFLDNINNIKNQWINRTKIQNESTG